MTGTIAEVPLPDLIQLFSTSKKTGTLIVEKDGHIGKIHLEQGQLVSAGLNNAPGLPALKTIFRILSWEDGTFELGGPEPYSTEDVITMPTEHILMEGLRQLDEIRHMQKKLPPLDSELVVVTPLISKLAGLEADELDVFQLIYNFGTVEAVLSRATINDVDVANIVLKLIKDSYIAKV